MSSSDPVYKTIVDITTKGAGAFVDIFYKNFDTNRNVIHKFYRPSSRIVWNGNPYAGAQAFSEFAAKLPATIHEVQSYDCHPLVSSNTNAGQAPDIMLIVSGSVKYGTEATPRGFSQTFNLKQDPAAEKLGTYYVDTDCFRQVVLT